MALSQDALQGILASSTDIVYLECLTIAHSKFIDGTLRLVNDRVDLVRTAGTFIAFPFSVTPPAQDSKQSPFLEITADMVDQRIIQAIRMVIGQRERAQISYEIVTHQHPNTVEWGPVDFQFDSATTDGVSILKIKASFSLGLLEDAFPTKVFSPGNRNGV